MRRFIYFGLLWCAFSVCAADLAGPPQMQPGLAKFLIRFGLKDQAPTKWDGEVRVVGDGKVTRVEGWRFGRDDKVDGSRWQAATRAILPNNPFQMRIPTAQMPPSDNGVLVTLDGAIPATRLEMTTPRGNIAFALQDVPYGKSLPALDGQADVRRTPPTWQLTSSHAAYILGVPFTPNTGLRQIGPKICR